MENNTFKTMHDINYLNNSYLYHYSSFEKAMKIIYYNNLRFSNIYYLNDTTEYKPKILFSQDNPLNEKVLKYCQDINRLVKVCCFTQDNPKIKRFKKGNDLYFTDYSGRGFAFPRMWAQYATDNKGVCFIINREKLENAISKRFQIIGKGPIKYVDRYSCFTFTPKATADFNVQVIKRNITAIAANKFMETYPKYISENYFTKLSDWRDEHEYRIALFSPDGENLTIDNFSSFLEGIVIGENADEVDKEIIERLLKKKVPIKRILFQHTRITLE